jgi:hypothetical protein
VYRFDGDEALLAATQVEPVLAAMLAAEGRGWVEVDDASYCTQVPVDTPDDIRHRLLEVLMDECHDPVVGGHSVKKLGERLSWISTAALGIDGHR